MRILLQFSLEQQSQVSWVFCDLRNMYNIAHHQNPATYLILLAIQNFVTNSHETSEFTRICNGIMHKKTIE